MPEVVESQSIGDGDVIVENAIDPTMEKLVVRKIDRVVLPLMALVYSFNVSSRLLTPRLNFFNDIRYHANVCACLDLDKQTMTYAAVFGLRPDFNLSGSQYSWAVSLLYFGQLASEYPAIYLMSRLHLVRFLGVCM